MRATTIHFEEVEHNFFHVKNQWILIGKGSTNLEKQIFQISRKANQVIHWFIDLPLVQMNEYNTSVMADRGISTGGQIPELHIHVPKYAKDYIPRVREWLTKCGVGEIKIICEECGPVFAMGGKHDHRLAICYDASNRSIYARIDLGNSHDCITGLNDYQTKGQREQWSRPITKEGQIASFKATTPQAILNSFKDDEDIWNFLQDERQAAMTPKKHTITLKADPSTPKGETMLAIARTVADALHISQDALVSSPGEGGNVVFRINPDVNIPIVKEESDV